MLLGSVSQGRALVQKRNAATAPAAPCVRGLCGRGALVVRKAVEVPPSRRTAADELESLSRLSTVVPDTVAFETAAPVDGLAAASVSASTLRSVLMGESLGRKPFENAINVALAVRGSDSPLSSVRDPVDRAMANVGAMLAEQVTGRVETMVDPRLARDEAALLSKARQLVAAYERLGVAADRLVFGLPGTWEGIQAAKALEADGIATSVYSVFGMTQGVAAMQAGVSVIRIPVGRIHDWFDKHPGALLNRQGPREDAGVPSSTEPGVELVKKLYCYGRRYHPKTRIMASSLRSRKDALELAGVDYLVLSGRIMEQLSAIPTDQGYNDGLSAVAGSTGVEAALSPEVAAAANIDKWEALTKEGFSTSMELSAKDLLAASLEQRARDYVELDKLVAGRSTGSD